MSRFIVSAAIAGLTEGTSFETEERLREILLGGDGENDVLR